MRGEQNGQPQMFCMFHLEDKIRKNHPLRKIKVICDQILKGMDETFEAMYAKTGRPSIPPEILLKSQLLIALYTVRSDRLFCEKLETDLLFQWFLETEADEAVFDHSTFSKNRERLLEHEVAEEFFARVVSYARDSHLLSDEHFTVDGTLIESLASLKSFRKKGEKWKGSGKNPDVDFRGEKRVNETHESTTDPESRLYRKSSGTAAELCFIGNALMENRNGLCVGFQVDTANGTAERTGAMGLVKDLMGKKIHPTTLGGDKNYHTQDFVSFCREHEIRPHVAEREGWEIEGLDGRTTRHAGYEISQRKRKLIEQKFGWAKTVGGLRKSRFIGRRLTEMWGLIVMSAYNLVRIRNLTESMV